MAKRGSPILMTLNRRTRLAIGMSSLGYPIELIASEIGVTVGLVRSLQHQALEHCGFKASNNHTFVSGRARYTDRGVYVLGGVGVGVVKVGWSDDIDRRIHSVSQNLPFDTVLIGKIQFASPPMERQIHREMQQWHKRAEWFYLTPSSRQFLSSRFGIDVTEDVACKIGVCHDPMP